MAQQVLPLWHSVCQIGTRVASTLAERQRKHRDKRRAAGMCAYPGCKKLTGQEYYCIKHGEAHAARMKAARSTPEACEQEWPGRGPTRPKGEWPA